jgi:hypothetical protein
VKQGRFETRNLADVSHVLCSLAGTSFVDAVEPAADPTEPDSKDSTCEPNGD